MHEVLTNLIFNAGDDFTDLWVKQVLNPDAFERELVSLGCLGDKGKEDWRNLAGELRQIGAQTGSIPVCKDLWPRSNPLELLWTAFPIVTE